MLEQNADAQLIAEHYWLARFWEQLVFSPDYSAHTAITDLIVPTEFGKALIQQCSEQTGVLVPDATLAIYGHFFWQEVLIDCLRSNLNGVLQLLNDELRADRVRIPFIWGRELHDRFVDQPQFAELDIFPHNIGWQFLVGTPVGVFQHGYFVSGPLGVIRSVEHRWLPVFPVVSRFYRQGTETKQRSIPFETASIGVVSAHAWLEQHLTVKCGQSCEWGNVLAWHGSPQRPQQRTDYADIAPVIGDCLIGAERTLLLEKVLKTEAGTAIRNAIKVNPTMKGLASLPPADLASKFDQFQQLQLLLVLPTRILVENCDLLILERHIDVPPSEVRFSRRHGPSKGICFDSELSSLGIRPAHPKPFAALCSAILRAYDETDSSNELAWRLGSDPSRGLQVSLTEFVRREGPTETISRLILASQSVTSVICKELGLKLDEVVPRTDRTIPRMLWKFGFEIPRHDEVLDRLNRRIQRFEEMISQIDLLSGEPARESIRAEGVNLFVSVEEFLDRLIAFNVWMISADHWAETRFEYRPSDARRSVATVLGDRIETPDGAVGWNISGENPLGAQLMYLRAFEQWLDRLENRDGLLRADLDGTFEVDDFQRPFQFRHTQLWADSDIIELERYKELFRKTAKAISQADVAGVRNGLDHQRDPSRFPTDAQLEQCINRLKAGVRSAEQNRIYPVTFWFDSCIEKVFGANEYIFRNNRDELFSVFRPSTVSSIPAITRINPVIFAPVNFLGAADSLLSFKLMGQSEFSRYWSNYPRISKVLPAKTIEGISSEDFQSTRGCDTSDSVIAEVPTASVPAELVPESVVSNPPMN